MATVIAVFDLEGTLCWGGQILWRETMRWRRHRRHGRLRVMAHLAVLIPVALLHRMKLVTERRMRLILIGNMATLYQGLDDHELAPLVDSAAGRIYHQARPDMVTIHLVIPL